MISTTSDRIVLASGSEIRRTLLVGAGLDVQIIRANIDEDLIKQALVGEGASPRDIADSIAEAKARKISAKNPGRLVVGCDQVLEHKGTCLSKPENLQEAKAQLTSLRNDRHTLLSAAVIYENGEPIWRHVGIARLQMRDFSDTYLDDYLERNWSSIRDAVGAYKLEEEGIRLFSSVQGDYFTVLGLPLLEMVNYLILRGVLPR